MGEKGCSRKRGKARGARPGCLLTTAKKKRTKRTRETCCAVTPETKRGRLKEEVNLIAGEKEKKKNAGKKDSTYKKSGRRATERNPED